MQFHHFQASLLACSLLFVLSNSPALAQIKVQDDFEGNGTITTWTGDDCQLNTALPNPVAQGSNTSATVLEYHDVGGTFANVYFEVAQNFDLSTHHTFQFKIYLPSTDLTGNQPNQVALKLQDGTLGSPWSTQSTIVKSISPDQWQTVSFDFKNDSVVNLDPTSPSPTQRSDFNRVLIQVNGENNSDQVRAYIDDFSYDGSLPAPPVFNKLVWSDEFNGSGALDTAKWFHQTQLPSGGSWFNGEIQHYTNRLANTNVSNGTLKLIAQKETFTDQGVTKNYTSARLNSKYAFTYGKVEVRAKLPKGVGTWPAIWMLGKNIDEDGAYWDNQGLGTTPWPACGEIDIMEHWGSNQNFVQSATHTPSSFGGTVNHGGQTIPTASTAFHVYTLEWLPNRLIFKVDGRHHYTYRPAVRDANTWPFNDPQYILLNIAIEPSIAASFSRDTMEVDYLRIYEQSKVSLEEQAKQPQKIRYSNPVQEHLDIYASANGAAALPCRVHNLQGQVVLQRRAMEHDGHWRLGGWEHLPKGLYLVTFVHEDKNYALKVVRN